MRHLSHYHKNLTFRFKNGAAGADLVQALGAPCAGEILHIRQINSQNSNAVTAKITIENEYSQVVFDGTAKAHNASHDHEFVTIRRILAGNDVVKCTISGDPGALNFEIEIIIDLYGRDA